MTDTTTRKAVRYAIRIKSLNPRRDETGFLGTADDTHIVKSAADARHFPSLATALAEIHRLKAKPGHFLAESRMFAAYSVVV